MIPNEARVANIVALNGKGSAADRSANMCEAILTLCYDMGDGMARATVVGVLELVKTQIIMEGLESD